MCYTTFAFIFELKKKNSTPKLLFWGELEQINGLSIHFNWENVFDMRVSVIPSLVTEKMPLVIKGNHAGVHVT